MAQTCPYLVRVKDGFVCLAKNAKVVPTLAPCLLHYVNCELYKDKGEEK